MGLAERIEELIGPTVEGMGFELVRVRLSGKQRMTLQVMAEPADGRTMTVDDCADISRAVSAILDVEDPIQGAYSLEVSSPGLDRPLVKLRDFDRFAGHEAKVELDRPLDGRKRFRGKLLGTEAEEILLDLEGTGNVARFPFADLHRANLVITDELLASMEGRKKP